MAVTRTLRRHAVKKPRQLRREAKRAGLALPCALAMLEMETAIPQRNIFGCDQGAGRTFCHQRVTRKKVRALLASGLANGVGWTQLTYRPFVIEAERLGGAHRPRNQMRVGFAVLADNIRRLGVQAGFAAYNGSGPAADAYGRDAVAKAARWSSILS